MTFTRKKNRLFHGGPLNESERLRFKLLNRLVKHHLIVIPSGCWVKEGANIRKYSSIKFGNRVFGLHSLSAILFNNHDIENDNLIVCHKCDIEGCCNPNHLYSGTAQDNSRDMRFRRINNIPKGQVINRIKSEIKEFDLDFISDKVN